MKIVINQMDITDYQLSVNATLILESINNHQTYRETRLIFI